MPTFDAGEVDPNAHFRSCPGNTKKIRFGIALDLCCRLTDTPRPILDSVGASDFLMTQRHRTWPVPAATVFTAAIVLVSLVTGSTGAEPKSPFGVVVLKDGRVFSGTISEVAGGYRVDRSDGHVVIPFEQTRLTAESLLGAYETLRDGIRRPTAEDHLVLAEWCLDNKLLPQARTEAAAALTLEPLRSDAKALLRKVDSLMDSAGGLPSTESGVRGGTLIRTADGYVLRSETASSGLSRETQQDFIRRIQPLLVNSCGNAGCHGASSMQPPVLQSARVGSANHRQASQNNLEVILRYIDSASPSTSPVLTILDGTNAGHPRVFTGRAGTEQYLVLKAWVEQVAREGAGQFQPSGKTSQTVAVPSPLPISPAGIRPMKSAAPESASLEKTAPAREAQMLEELRISRQPDAFDPDEFNRRVHGATAAELRQRSSPPAAVTSPE